MASVNKVILIGHLGRDPEIRIFQNGGKVCNLSVATSESWKDKTSGERKERTEWHRVVIFNDRLADVAERFLKKGSKVYLEGSLETRKWTDQSGAEKYSTEVVLRQFRGEIVMLDSPSDEATKHPLYEQMKETQAVIEGNPTSPAPKRPLDDEIPW